MCGGDRRIEEKRLPRKGGGRGELSQRGKSSEGVSILLGEKRRGGGKAFSTSIKEGTSKASRGRRKSLYSWKRE